MTFLIALLISIALMLTVILVFIWEDRLDKKLKMYNKDEQQRLRQSRK